MPRCVLQIDTATGFWRRFVGLMLTPGLAPDHALLIPRCPSVHTCFMRYPLDLAYLDVNGRVVKLVERLRPWRASFGGPAATQVLELAGGGIEQHAIKLGDYLVHEAPARRASDRADVEKGLP